MGLLEASEGKQDILERLSQKVADVTKYMALQGRFL